MLHFVFLKCALLISASFSLYFLSQRPETEIACGACRRIETRSGTTVQCDNLPQVGNQEHSISKYVASGDFGRGYSTVTISYQ